MLLDPRGNPIRSSASSTAPVFSEIGGIGGGRDITRPYAESLGVLEPLDELLASRETTLRGYKKILRDGQVQATFQQRRLAVVSREWEVRPGGTKQADKKASDWLEEQLTHFGWDRVADRMLFGVFYGFATGELMYQRDGQYVGVDRVKVRDRERFAFGPDFDLRLLTMDDQLRGEPMPPRKFWVFSTGSDHDDDPYGLGLAHFLYWPVFFKRHGLSFWLKNLERWAQPIARGKYAPGTPPHEQSKLLSTLYAIQHDAGIIYPEGMDVDLLEAKRAGTADYKELDARMDATIAKVVLSQTMTTDAASTGLGSTQGEVQERVAEDVQKADADLLVSSFSGSGAFGDGPLRWLMEWNFPGAAIPEIHYQFEEAEDLNQVAERDQKLHASGWERTEQSQQETYGEGWVKKAAPTPNELADTPQAGATDATTDATASGKTMGDAVRFAEDGPYDPAETPDVLAEAALAEARVDGMMAPVERLLAEADSLEEFRDGLFALFAEMDAAEFGGVLQRALLTAELSGRYEVAQEGTDADEL